jgi:hypothetical protein
MKSSLWHSLNANPDLAAIGLLVVLLTSGGGPSSPRLSLIFASDRPAALLADRAREVCGQLDHQMRGLEERLEHAAE